MASLEDVHAQLLAQREILDQTIADVEELIAAEQPPAQPDVIPVHAGDDLPAMIANGADGAFYLLDPDFTWNALEVWKSCTISGPEDGPMPVITHSIKACAMNVALSRLTVRGNQRDATLIECADWTSIVDCHLEGSPDGQRRGVLVNCGNVLIDTCSITGIWHDQDAMAIGGWNRTANLVVKDCHLEASGENIMFGGADPENVNAVPHDILIERCHMSKPWEWQNFDHCTVKNLFELKNARRVQVRNCTFENCWRDGQDGWGLVLTVRNQEGTAPYSTVEDVLIEDCTFDSIGAGINILARDDLYQSEVMSRVVIRRCAFHNLNPGIGAGRCVQIMAGPHDLTLEQLIFEATIVPSCALEFGQPKYLAERLVIDRCDWPEGWYGIHGDDAPGLGKVVIDMYAPGYEWTDVTVHKQQTERWIEWPLGTTVIDETGGG